MRPPDLPYFLPADTASPYTIFYNTLYYSRSLIVGETARLVLFRFTLSALSLCPPGFPRA